jgi:hypothetical protein
LTERLGLIPSLSTQEAADENEYEAGKQDGENSNILLSSPGTTL